MTEERGVVATIRRGDAPETPPRPSDPLTRGVAVVMCTYRRARSMEGFLDSLAEQTERPVRLIIVDASPDTETEELVRNRRGELAASVAYFRVAGPLKGLTRQRNFGIRWVDTDLVAFFDDDVVLRPGCLAEMERVHRATEGAVGVGGYTEGSYMPPDRLWRTRRTLGIVGDLRPGSYQRSGMSVPWAFLPPTDDVVEADWLPGCAMMWKTAVLREIGFSESFEGYAQGEDLDFSLRARRKGKLLVAGAARFLHLFDESGRPDHVKMGFMALYNRYQIQRRGLDDRTWKDVLWFVYAWGLDTLMLGRHFLFPRRFFPTLQHLSGRFKAAALLLKGDHAP